MTRVLLHVHVNLDPVPGVFHTAESAKVSVQRLLTDAIEHYQPVVALAEEPEMHYVDRAMFISPRSIAPGEPFFMDNNARVGEYCVRSTDPVKQDLYLPAYIFHKCFRLPNGDKLGEISEFVVVKEIA